jgi:CBS domain-containing protein
MFLSELLWMLSDARYGCDDNRIHYRWPGHVGAGGGERGISGVPVVDAGDRLIGIVIEGDLLPRVES